MILYCIRFFGATSGKFNFSNLQQPKEEKVKRPTSTFSALTSLIHVQGLHSHYQHTQTHTPCLSPALGPHTALSRSCPSHQPGSSLGTMNASLKGVFPPCSTKLGLGFSQVFPRCPQWWAPDKAFLSARELQNQECGLHIYGQRNIQRFCSLCLLITGKNDCAVPSAFQLSPWNLCSPVDIHLRMALFYFLFMTGPEVSMQSVCPGLDPADRMSFPAPFASATFCLCN